jgi:hypothetical protein
MIWRESMGVKIDAVGRARPSQEVVKMGTVILAYVSLEFCPGYRLQFNRAPLVA